MTQRISDIISYQLSKLNREHPPIQLVKANGAERVRKAIVRANENLSKVNITVDDQEMSAEDIQQMKIKMPDAFKQKPIMYEATATEDLGEGWKQILTFSLEVTD